MFFGFKDLSIAYNGTTILNSIDMSFEEGAVSTILGLNGTGKTSLLKTISGSLEPKSGCVIFQDRNIAEFSRKEIAKNIAYLSQVHSCPSDITVRTLVSMGRFPYRQIGTRLNAQDNRAIDKALEMTRLQDLQERRVCSLSGGESQRAWIAMALAQEPKIIVLDEPTTHLDMSFQTEILDLLERLNKETGLTIVMVLHDINLASRYSDNVFVIGDKRLLAHGKAQEVLTTENLQKFMNISSTEVTDPVSGKAFFIPRSEVLK